MRIPLGFATLPIDRGLMDKLLGFRRPQENDDERGDYRVQDLRFYWKSRHLHDFCGNRSIGCSERGYRRGLPTRGARVFLSDRNSNCGLLVAASPGFATLNASATLVGRRKTRIP